MKKTIKIVELNVNQRLNEKLKSRKSKKICSERLV